MDVYLTVSITSIVAASLVGIVKQRRLRARDRMAFDLGRHIFDQTLNPTVLSDLASFEKDGGVINFKSMIEAPPTPDSG